jgi:hypothetical protein
MNEPTESTSLLRSSTQGRTSATQGRLKEESVSEKNERYSNRNIILLVLASLIPIGLVYSWSSMASSVPMYATVPATRLPEGTKIKLSSVVHEKFIRAENGNLILTETIPWEKGSTFEVYRYDDECFQLKSMQNLWVTLDYETGQLKADGLTKLDGDFFTAVATGSSNPVDNEKLHIYLKVCRRDLWLEVAPTTSISPASTDPAPDNSNQATTAPLAIQLTSSSMNIIKSSFLAAYFGQRTLLQTQPSTAVLQLQVSPVLKGVNLGSWFIPEVWMNPSFYKDTGLGWGGSICR